MRAVRPIQPRRLAHGLNYTLKQLIVDLLIHIRPIVRNPPGYTPVPSPRARSSATTKGMATRSSIIDVSHPPAPTVVEALHSLPYAARLHGWWDTLFALTVVALAKFWEALPHLIQFGGLIVVILTGIEKLIALGWIKNPRRQPKENPDDLG